MTEFIIAQTLLQLLVKMGVGSYIRLSPI